MKYLVTQMNIKTDSIGQACGTGCDLVNKLLEETDWQSLDNINDYCDVNLKYARLKETGIERDKIEEAQNLSFNNAIIQSLMMN